MNHARRFAKLLLATVLLSLMAFGIAADLFFVSSVMIVVAAAGWWINELPRSQIASPSRGQSGQQPVAASDTLPAQAQRSVAIPRWISTSILTVIVAYAGVRGYQEHDAVSIFAWLLAAILLLKMWEDRHHRDYGQMLTITVYLTIGATLADTSPLLGLILLIQIPTLLWAVIYYQLIIAAHRAGARNLPGERSQASHDRGVKRFTTTALIGACAIAVGAFILIPRGIGLRQLGDFAQLNAQRSTNFTETVDLEQGGPISDSLVPVFDVQVENGFGQRIGSDSKALYLRGTVLDEYKGREWRRSTARDDANIRILRPLAGSPTADLSRPSNHPETRANPLLVIKQKFTARQSVKADGPLFAMWRPRFITITGGAEIRYDTTTAYLFRHGEPGRLEYEVVSNPMRYEDVEIPPPERTAMQLESATVEQTARNVLRAAGLEPDPKVRPQEQDIAAANALAQFLRETCTYTLDVPRPPTGSDPVEWFLTRSKTGHCELFAATLTTMCRSLGINARLIAGFLATEYDAALDKYIVRRGNAHAWCEVYVGDGRWETIDPTPPSSLDQMKERHKQWQTRVARFFADMRDEWNFAIVGFDATSQQKLLGVSEREGPWYDGIGLAALSGAYKARKFVVSDMALPTRRIGLACGIAFVLAAFGLLWKVRFARAAVVSSTPGWALSTSAVQQRIYAAALRRCNQCGLPKPPWRPLQEHAAVVSAAQPAAGRGILAASRALYAAAFDGREIDPAAARSLLAGMSGRIMVDSGEMKGSGRTGIGR